MNINFILLELIILVISIFLFFLQNRYSKKIKGKDHSNLAECIYILSFSLSCIYSAIFFFSTTIYIYYRVL